MDKEDTLQKVKLNLKILNHHKYCLDKINISNRYVWASKDLKLLDGHHRLTVIYLMIIP